MKLARLMEAKLQQKGESLRADPTRPRYANWRWPDVLEPDTKADILHEAERVKVVLGPNEHVASKKSGKMIVNGAELTCDVNRDMLTEALQPLVDAVTEAVEEVREGGGRGTHGGGRVGTGADVRWGRQPCLRDEPQPHRAAAGLRRAARRWQQPAQGAGQAPQGPHRQGPRRPARTARSVQRKTGPSARTERSVHGPHAPRTDGRTKGVPLRVRGASGRGRHAHLPGRGALSWLHQRQRAPPGLQVPVHGRDGEGARDPRLQRAEQHRGLPRTHAGLHGAPDDLPHPALRGAGRVPVDAHHRPAFRGRSNAKRARKRDAAKEHWKKTTREKETSTRTRTGPRRDAREPLGVRKACAR